ncbi:MAG: hypothetical protein DMG54_00980 [Acidobacteria bacterium]|nr:MAG: hypothetical protein DMG54_00980 [Acidobacteriota bacterium]PYU69950.1 MAG: hypothetical protein DMG52_27190 [Acidobacteriota bacterium]
MRRQGERPELIRWRLCGTSKTWSFVPQRRMKMFRARVRLSKTMSVRMDRENYDFLHEITKEEGSDLSKAVRDMVTRGRILLAVERYKKGEVSLGRAAELAGVPVGQMMTILTEFGVESRLEKEDYLQGLKDLQKVW